MSRARLHRRTDCRATELTEATTPVLASPVRLSASSLGVVAFLAWVLLPIAGLAQTTFVSNLDNAASNGIFVYETQWLAGAFTTGAHAGGYTLDHVDIAFTGVASDATFAVSLWSNAEAAPDVGLGSFVHNAGGQFEPAGFLSVQPLTTYWLVLSSDEAFDGGSSFAWLSTADSLFAVSGGWSVAGAFAGSDDQGAEWSLLPSDYVFAVTATAVPEPAAYATLLGGLALAGVLVRRRRRGPRAVEQQEQQQEQARTRFQ